MKNIILIFIALTFLGCVTAEVKTPDGMEVRYSSYGDKNIDSVSFSKTKTGFKFQMNGVETSEQDVNVPGVGEIK